MPSPLLYGPHPSAVGPRQVAAVPATKAATPPIQLDRWFRNGKAPDATCLNMMNEAANQAALYRTKEVFSILGRTQQSQSSTVAARKRWRAAFRTGPYGDKLYVMAIMLPPSSGYDQNSSAKLEVFSDTAEATVVSSRTLTYGSSPTGASTASGVQYWKRIEGFLEGLTPNTNYYLAFTDQAYGRLHSATVFELQSMTTHFDGYLPQNFTEQSQILDTYRRNLAAVVRELWLKAGAKVFTWSVDDGSAPIQTTSATPTNIIDGTSTAVSAATPGFTLDMRYKNRASSSTVPVEFVAFGSCTVGTNGVIVVKDSAGVVQAAISTAWSATPSWQRASCILPATLDKYDVQFYTAAGTFSLYAVSAYEY